MVYNDWEAFWLKRGPVRFEDIKPFLHNFYIMFTILQEHFGEIKGLKSLEVGAGRGTMSHYLTNFDVDVHTLDMVNKIMYSKLLKTFTEGDALDLPFEKDKFDIVFTYGLLEHFNIEQQVDALNGMMDITKPGGLNIHYIVPLKWTNLFEDRNVKRDDCFFLRQQFPMLWTYPIISWGGWKTNKWLGKGAFFTLEKTNAITRVSYGKVEQ